MEKESIEALTAPVVFFTMVLALSLLTERFIEVVKVFFDYLDYRIGLDKFWTKRAKRFHEQLSGKISFLSKVNPRLEEKTIARYRNRSLNQSGAYKGKTTVISGDMMRVVFTRIAAKVVGIAFGVWLAIYLKIDLFAYIDPTYKAAAYQFSYKTIISGMVIGLGAGPIHKLITTIERARKKHLKKTPE